MVLTKIVGFKHLLLFGSLLLTSFFQEKQIHIVLKNNSENEIKAKAQLERIIKQFPDAVKLCISSDTVLINEQEYIPHSHPRITLNARNLWNDTVQLAVFLHEGLHWKVEAMNQQREQAISELKKLFPEAPDKGPLGAQNLYSTYLHLIVCDLELQALELAIGTNAARTRLRRKPYYTWVYEQVLNNPDVRKINIKYDFVLNR